MANKYESAKILLKLYELRREETMRDARNWFIGFRPHSAQEIVDTIRGKNGAKYRMVVSYWDMAATFVSHDVIDEQMFQETILEHVAVFSKIDLYLTELRSIIGEPDYLKNLEKLVRNLPNADERLELFRKRMKVLAAANEAARENES